MRNPSENLPEAGRKLLGIPRLDRFESLARRSHWFPSYMMTSILWVLVQMVGVGPWEEAETWLSGVEGIRLVEVQEGKFEVQGKIYRSGDKTKVREFVSKFPDVVDKTTESRAALTSVLEEELVRRKSRARIVSKGSDLWLEGSVDASTLRNLQKLHPGLRRKGAATGLTAPTIFLELVLMELKNSALKRLGTRIGSPLEIRVGGGNRLGQPIRMSSLRAFVDLALQNGEARIHSKQSLVTQNGKNAEFLAGGEIPIRVVGENTAYVEYKTFGLRLSFTPQIVNRLLVNLKIDSEISEIDLGSQVDGLPMISKKKINTQIYAKFDEMIAIGGLVRSGDSKFVDTIPGLGQIPILGRLFRSEDFRRLKSEAYMFITPSRLDKPWQPKPEGM